MPNFKQRLKLDSIDIEEPPQLSGLIEKVFSTDSKSFKFTLASLKAPLLVYVEALARNEHGIIAPGSRIEYHIANDRGQGVTHYSIERNVLRLNGGLIREAERGNILVAFCKIEFIVDILLLFIEGVYEGKCSYLSFYEKMMQKNGSAFHTFENKKKYLRLKKMIRKDTYSQLSKVQKIRNHIAHQYFLDGGVGLTTSELIGYESLNDAVETIFNHCWLLLLRDYNPHQVKILEGLTK